MNRVRKAKNHQNKEQKQTKKPKKKKTENANQKKEHDFFKEKNQICKISTKTNSNLIDDFWEQGSTTLEKERKGLLFFCNSSKEQLNWDEGKCHPA